MTFDQGLPSRPLAQRSKILFHCCTLLLLYDTCNCCLYHYSNREALFTVRQSSIQAVQASATTVVFDRPDHSYDYRSTHLSLSPFQVGTDAAFRLSTQDFELPYHTKECSSRPRKPTNQERIKNLLLATMADPADTIEDRTHVIAEKLKAIYKKSILPVEKKYRYDYFFESPLLSDVEFDCT